MYMYSWSHIAAGQLSGVVKRDSQYNYSQLHCVSHQSPYLRTGARTFLVSGKFKLIFKFI